VLERDYYEIVTVRLGKFSFQAAKSVGVGCSTVSCSLSTLNYPFVITLLKSATNRVNQDCTGTARRVDKCDQLHFISNLTCYMCQKRNKKLLFSIVFKQERGCTYNGTLRRVHATIVADRKQ